MWRARNGGIDIRPVYNVTGVTLYTTKEAAMTGELVWSDTLPRYRDRTLSTNQIRLHPEA
jgi:hypothetical protein